MDFAYPEVAEQRLHQQRAAVFEEMPPEERGVRLVEIVDFSADQAISPTKVAPAQITDAAKEVFARIYEDNRDKIYRYLYTHMGNADTAEELTSVVFMKVLESMPKYEERGLPVSAWLYRIAHNLMVDEFRKSKRTNGPSLDTVDYRIGYVQEGNIVESVDTDQRGKLLRSAIKKLSPEHQMLIQLQTFQELTSKEIAIMIGKTDNSIRIGLYRARAELRQLLNKEDFFDTEE